MSRDFVTATFFYNTREYHAAAEFFARAYRAGYKLEDSLYYHGKCKLLEATFQLQGMGGFVRKTALISAARALEDRIKLYGTDYYTIAELCCVQYALGLMHKPSDGWTHNFKAYYKQLMEGDPSQIEGLEEFLAVMEKEYRHT